MPYTTFTCHQYKRLSLTLTRGNLPLNIFTSLTHNLCLGFLTKISNFSREMKLVQKRNPHDFLGICYMEYDMSYGVGRESFTSKHSIKLKVMNVFLHRNAL